MATRVGTLTNLLLIATLLSAPAFAADSNFHSNEIKYSDAGQKPATGRSGDATIQALALRGKDGTTEVTVTSNGSIDKVQLKFHDQSFNYHGSGNTFTTRLSGLGRRTPIDVQANVSDADPARTGVVSVTENVKMRPELAMQYVAAPPHALAGAPVHIVADVGEQWGDMGARTNCVLLQNGIEIDRAENIWIDADRIVACEFATVFPPGSGTVTLQVSLRDTMPADYDTSSDTSAPFSIKVYDDLAGIDQWNARAFQSKYSSRWYSRDTWGESESITNGHIADAQFNAQFRSTQPNVETLRASVRLTTDGRILSENHDVWFDFQPGQTQQCALAWMGERNNFLRACHFVTTWAGEFTSINYSWATGDVTYLSRGWYSMYVGGPPAYVWYWNYRDIWGNGMELGESVTFELQFSDGTNYWFANPTVPLTTSTYSYGEPLTCWGEAPYQSCFEYGGAYTTKSGSISGGGR